MRIVHVITRLVAGGAQRNTLLCARDQVQRGHSVTVITGTETGSEGSLLEAAREDCFKLIELPSLVREVYPRKDLVALFQLCFSLQSLRPEILHTHTSKAGLLGRLAGRLCRVPVIVHTPHGHIFHSYFPSIQTKVFIHLERFLTQHFTDALVMLSPGELRDHRQVGIGSSQSTVVIPSGVPLERFLRCSRQLNANPVIGYVGRLAPVKGVADLLDAFGMVQRNFPQARLMIVGDGPQREEIESRVMSLGLEAKVSLLGWREDTQDYLMQMDILVVPSHNEGMGRVAVEGMAAGLPIVATDVGGLPDLVQNKKGGWLARPQCPTSLAEAIENVLRLEDRGASMGETNRQAAQAYSDHVMFHRLESLYSRVSRLKGCEKTPL